MANKDFGPLGFMLRWLFALLLVAATFNPSGWSYYHWITGPTESLVSLQVLTGLVLTVLYVIYLRATWRSIGLVGVILAGGILGTLIWLLVDMQWLNLDSTQVVGWIGVVVLATIMGVGLSWSHIRRRVTGQFDTDEADD